MSESLANIYIPTPFVFVLLAVVVLANVYLVLTNYKSRYMLWWAKKTVGDIDGRLKEELVRGVGNIEKLETNLNFNHICVDRFSREDDPLSYRLREPQKETSQTSQIEQLKEGKKRPELVSRQLIIPGFDEVLCSQS